MQEIDPQHTLSNSQPSADDGVGEVTPEDLKALSSSLQGNRLQERRMNIFSFEAYSLPASRVRLSLCHSFAIMLQSLVCFTFQPVSRQQ